VLSGAAPIPWRSRAAEQELENKPLTAKTIAAAAAAAVADAVPLSKNSYKTAMFQGLLEEELAKAAEKIAA
jgi:xanthine dehydrogenase YagS FAD-binding subunit